MKYTPGEWKAVFYHKEVGNVKSKNPGGGIWDICTVYHHNDTYLIAAAPDLLEACKFALKHNTLRNDIDVEVNEKLKAAIAKAIGKQE